MNEISNDFNYYIYDNYIGINIIRLKLKVLGEIEDIYEELEKIKKINNADFNYTLRYKGKFLKKEYKFEQLEVSNNSKFLLLNENIVKYTVTKFSNVGRNCFTYSIDSICFSPSQK